MRSIAMMLVYLAAGRIYKKANNSMCLTQIVTVYPLRRPCRSMYTATVQLRPRGPNEAQNTPSPTLAFPKALLTGKEKKKIAVSFIRHASYKICQRAPIITVPEEMAGKKRNKKKRFYAQDLRRSWIVRRTSSQPPSSTSDVPSPRSDREH